MIKTLYKPFQQWSEKGSVWIISDTHFDDKDCKLMDKNWLSPKKHIENIKKYVHKNDTLIHLGDVGNPVYLSDLKCYKVLIMGNHDKRKSNYERKLRKFEYNFPTIEDAQKALKNGDISYFNWTRCINRAIGWVDNYLFDEIYEGPLMIAEKLILSHEPLYINWAFNIHGHVHTDYIWDDRLELNLASNRVDYLPYNLGHGIKNGLLSKVDSVHKQTINRAKVKSELKKVFPDIIFTNDY